ncbi:hypothetical protein C1Y11_21880 [Pseudomonas sp. FW305-20]|nr:hypothetical protein C1Y11_21880 [Pseudomonas sp. FW305-20]PMU14896.1 hypothetical protein C1Y10_23905 [Pseudomonas sp. FW305-122]PMU36064.1 hypothetical protein C1Y12_23290 [Pseudomonas sp. FW305-47B]PMX60369.1 hypothetical protein C1Y13_14595 [Pseudomonas sp. FW305-33]PMX65496.1 hypothetical protein C1X12_19105 [Pseudomonas sp. FW305-60]
MPLLSRQRRSSGVRIAGTYRALLAKRKQNQQTSEYSSSASLAGEQGRGGAMLAYEHGVERWSRWRPRWGTGTSRSCGVSRPSYHCRRCSPSRQ